jgi:two-component system, OmpR family, response regulator
MSMNPATTKPRILVVEDQPIARDILTDLLRMAGYEAVCAGTGEQALVTLMRERGRVDGLFTEIELPGLVDGWIVAEEFRNTQPSGPVVFAGGPDRATTPRGAATDVVPSPVLPPKVVEAFARLYGRDHEVARSRRALREIAETGLDEPIESAPPVAAEGRQKARARGGSRRG